MVQTGPQRSDGFSSEGHATAPLRAMCDIENGLLACGNECVASLEWLETRIHLRGLSRDELDHPHVVIELYLVGLLGHRDEGCGESSRNRAMKASRTKAHQHGYAIAKARGGKSHGCGLEVGLPVVCSCAVGRSDVVTVCESANHTALTQSLQLFCWLSPSVAQRLRACSTHGGTRKYMGHCRLTHDHLQYASQ